MLSIFLEGLLSPNDQRLNASVVRLRCTSRNCQPIELIEQLRRFGIFFLRLFQFFQGSDSDSLTERLKAEDLRQDGVKYAI